MANAKTAGRQADVTERRRKPSTLALKPQPARTNRARIDAPTTRASGAGPQWSRVERRVHRRKYSRSRFASVDAPKVLTSVLG